MICPNCKRNIPDDSKFCPDCGTPIEQKKKPLIIDFDICIDELNKSFILTKN